MLRRAVAVLSFAAVSVIGCDRFYAVSGRVSSCADQRPVPDAVVHLSDESRDGFTTTKRDGSFDVALNEPDGDGPSTVTVAKVGYRTEEHVVSNPHVKENVCLKPEGK